MERERGYLILNKMIFTTCEWKGFLCLLKKRVRICNGTLKTFQDLEIAQYKNPLRLNNDGEAGLKRF
ncbi:hypothetical protein RIR_jg34721.t1 [Rhizophagus irregularis DAOM 181602=DAOM 197198]|nr:hypothetical protein RIR_jg34721.t1 [Rhizophagus irregularis DAOM 181602=DAOM 197198]